MTREVTIVQQVLPQYRLPLFEGLRQVLAADDIRLRLVHGRADGSKGDERELDWAEAVRNRELPLPGGHHALWQPVLRRTRGSDLVVIEHAARQVASWPLLARSRSRRGPKLALWGHGANLQAHRQHSLTEAVRRSVSRRAHWWFAYTAGSADRVAAHGFPRERITVVNNTVQVVGLTAPPEREPFTCVYVGALYDLKRISFLLEAGARLARRIPAFRLVVLGSGPDRHLVEEAATSAAWLDYRGATFDEEKAKILASSSLLLMPGLVGLAIVDAFAYGCPLVTVGQPFHSPEIEYLQDGVNGVQLPEGTSSSAYAEAVARLVESPDVLARLRDGCRRSAEALSMESMVERFAAGVRQALDAGP